MKKWEKERKEWIISMKRKIGEVYKYFCHFTGRGKNVRIKLKENWGGKENWKSHNFADNNSLFIGDIYIN
jgi:hypothetical protein